MSDGVQQGHDDAWESLSAMADGEADSAQQARWLAQWPSRGELRARWHEYQLIGDAMRSDELVGHAPDDAAFLRVFRQRVEREAGAVTTGAITARRMKVWIGSVAVAAGVGAVALTLNALIPASSGPATESTVVVSRALPAAPSSSALLEPTLRVVSGQLIRDARLDRYLAAHRQGANGAALQMPGAVVRSVDTIVLESK